MQPKQKIFISYAREDEDHARRLGRELISLGFEPWLDVRDMIAGGNWRMQIKDALDNCDYVILLLSKHSVENAGYIQVEKRRILEKLETMPPGEVFLIPARLEDCQPRHEAIQDLHLVDLFPSWQDGMEKIAQSLNVAYTGAGAAPAVEREGEAVYVQDYFDLILPTMLRWHGEEATALNKKVRWELMDQPAKSWTMHLRPPVATVVPDDPGDADLTISITSARMQSVLSGHFDARGAIAAGEIKLSGETGLLKSIGKLFGGGRVRESEELAG